jgi:hypothetical protein
MSKELVDKELARFLSSPQSQVLCISGKWGVGKTFAWRRALSDAISRLKADPGALTAKRYAYVSLFGINSLEGLKYAIFENTVRLMTEAETPSIGGHFKKLKSLAEEKGRKALEFGRQLPVVTEYVGSIGGAWFLLVKNQVICFDDLERKGDGLNVRDVLGLASLLKEEKNCKIVIVLNDEKLGDDTVEFATYLEKVVDIRLRFAPSVQECIDIVLGSGETDKLIAENCLTLGISNIRVIKKVKDFFGKIEPLVAGLSLSTRKAVVHSLTLLVWSVFSPDDAPSLEYLIKKRGLGLYGTDKKGELTPREAEWDALLDVYAFGHVDELDTALLDGVRNGFFDDKLVSDLASKADALQREGERRESFHQAWRLYHDSFADNKADLVEKLCEGFKNSIDLIDPMNLDGTVRILKDLGHAVEARNLIDLYVKSRKEPKKFFMLDESPWSTEISDPDVIAAFKAKSATFKDSRLPYEILLEMSKKRGWSPEELDSLANLPVSEYKETFLKNPGDDLTRIVKAALQFDQISNASPTMREISKRAKLALKEIGETSDLNRRRVEKKYNVSI